MFALRSARQLLSSLPASPFVLQQTRLLSTTSVLAAAPPPIGSPTANVTALAPHFKVLAKPHPINDDSNPPSPDLSPDASLQETSYKAVWSAEEVLAVKETHHPTGDTADKVALFGIRMVRAVFDIFSGYAFGPINEHKLLRRIIFLETVAGIPGMVAGSLRHLESLRRMKRDQGWIHTLLEEAENERMHLMCFTELKNPGKLSRFCALVAQGMFWNVYFVAYLASPSMCHRFVGYLEEEAVKTYTHAIEAYDANKLGSWQNKPAPNLAKKYWYLADDATMRDVLLAVRADEGNHRDVNHIFANTKIHSASPLHEPTYKEYK